MADDFKPYPDGQYGTFPLAVTSSPLRPIADAEFAEWKPLAATEERDIAAGETMTGTFGPLPVSGRYRVVLVAVDS